MSYLVKKDLSNKLGGQPGDDIRSIFRSAIESQNVDDGYGLSYQATLDTDSADGLYVPVGKTSADPVAIPAKWIKGYLECVIKLAQSGTNAPTGTIFVNELGGTITYSRSGVGAYGITFTGATQTMTTGKTHVFFNDYQDVDMDVIKTSLNTTSITFESYLAGATDDNILGGSVINIRVYP